MERQRRLPISARNPSRAELNVPVYDNSGETTVATPAAPKRVPFDERQHGVTHDGRGESGGEGMMMTHTKTQRGRQYTEPLEETKAATKQTSQARVPPRKHPAESGNRRKPPALYKRASQQRRTDTGAARPGVCGDASTTATHADDQSADRTTRESAHKSRRGAHHHRNRHRAGGDSCHRRVRALSATRGGRFTTKRAPAVRDNRQRKPRFRPGHACALAWAAGWGPL